MDCAACHLRHAVLATDVPISTGRAACHFRHAILAIDVPISMGSIACQFCHHILDAGVPISRDNAKFRHIIFVDGIFVPMGAPLGAVTAQQSPAPSMGDLWTNIRADLAKMQATLQKVEQGLLQIKAAVQHEQHQLALSARLRTSAVVGIQAAARGFLARQRVREMRRQMLEAVLVTVDLDTCGRDLTLSDGHQQWHRAAISKCEHGTCPAGDELQLYGSSGREDTHLVINKGALFSATTFRYRPPRGRLRWLLLRPIPGAHPCAPHSCRWRPWDPCGCTRACPPYLMG
jgi:hypothetical protein